MFVSQPLDGAASIPKLEIFSYDCKTAISSPDVITGNIGGIDEVKSRGGIPHEVRTTYMDVDPRKVEGSSVFEYIDGGNRGKLQFCAEVGVGLISLEAGLVSYVTSVKVEFDHRLYMNEDFSYTEDIVQEAEDAVRHELDLTLTVTGVPDRELTTLEKEAIETTTQDILQDSLDPSITLDSVVLYDFKLIRGSTQLATPGTSGEGRTLQDVTAEIIIRITLRSMDPDLDVEGPISSISGSTDFLRRCRAL